MPQGVGVVFVAVEGKPSLAADEVDEQQAVEQDLRVGGGVIGRHLGGEFGGGGVVGGLVVFEKPLGDRLDIEPVGQSDLKGWPPAMAWPICSKASRVVRLDSLQR